MAATLWWEVNAAEEDEPQTQESPGAGQTPEPTPVPLPTPSSAEGQQGRAVYAKAGCVGCHGEPGGAGFIGPNLAGIATAAGERDPSLPAEDYLRQSIAEPDKIVVAECPAGSCPAGIMPHNYGDTLSQAELDALVVYLLSLKTDTPKPTPTPVSGQAITTPETQPEASTSTSERVDATGLIVFSQARPTGVELFVAPSNGDDPIQLSESPANEILARWSPDATQIAYLRYDPETDGTDVWVMDPTAPAEPRPVTTHGMVDFDSYTWMPDGLSILYYGPQANGSESDVYQLKIDSGKVMTLTADYTGWDASPAPSPDGQWIAFVSDRSDQGKTLDEIWVMRPDGTDLANLTDNGDAWKMSGQLGRLTVPRSLSSAGNLAAAADAPGGPVGLWVMNADGNDQRFVYAYEGPVVEDAPVWSPDGKLIALTLLKEGDYDVWVVPSGGGEAVNVSNLPGDDTGISWSPELHCPDLHQRNRRGPVADCGSG